MRYPDPIIPDDQFKPSRLAAARLDQDHPCPWCGEALRLLQAGITVDALLTDIRLPEANGGEAATAYHERFPDLPVLYMTGYAERMRSVPGEIIISEPGRMAQVIGVLGAWAACVKRLFDERFIPARLHPG